MRLAARRTLPALALLVLGLGAACDGPEQDHALLGPAATPLLEEKSEGDGEEVTESGYSGATKAAAWIGSAGGSLSLAGHSITVPEGAVSHSLCFTMELGTGDAVDVDLHAWTMDSSESCKVEGDGAEGGEGWEGTLWTGEFEVPVTLALTYSRATNVDDPSTLYVAWVQSATETTPLSSLVDTASETVSGELDHFSQYALFFPS